MAVRVAEGGRASGGASMTEKLAAMRLNWPIVIGAALVVIGAIWWAISYSELTEPAGMNLFDATECFPFRGDFCEALVNLNEGTADTIEDTADVLRDVADGVIIPLDGVLATADQLDVIADQTADSTGRSFPLYYHLLSTWPGLFLMFIGLWRLTPLSGKPPEWFAPYQIPLFRILAVIVLLLLWWEAAARAGPNLLADPGATFRAAVDMIGEDRNRLRVALYESLSVYLSGYAIAAAVGIPIGLIFGGFRILGRTMEVFMNALMATPRIAFIPLIIVFLGLGFEAKTFVVFLGAVMPIMVNTYAGVRHSDGELVEMARSAGASRRQIFIRIMLPGALPFIVVGLRIGATIGLINTVVAEIYLAASGLGGLIGAYRAVFSPPNYLVVVLSLSLVGVVITSLLRVVETRTEKWRYNEG